MQRSDLRMECLKDQQTYLIAKFNLILIPSHLIRPKSLLVRSTFGLFYKKNDLLLGTAKRGGEEIHQTSVKGSKKA